MRCLFCLSGGLLMGLAVAPISLFPLAWIALIPLWLSVTNQAENLTSLKRFNWTSIRAILTDAIAWGLGYYGLALFWITGIHPLTWMGVPWLASLAITGFCWIAITLWGILLVCCWAIAMQFWHFLKDFLPNQIRCIKISQNRQLIFNFVGRICWGVTSWCLLETLWSNSPLWWSSLAYTQSPNNLWLLQWETLSGPNTITAFIVFVNAFFAEIIFIFFKQKIKPFSLGLLFSLPVSILIIFHLLGLVCYQKILAEEPQNAIIVGIIQGNIPNQIKLYPQGLEKAIAGYTSGYQQLVDSGAEVILTPEGALPYFWEDIVDYSPLYQAILKKKVPLWLGAYGHKDKTNYTNSLFSINAQGQLMGRYDKVKLVPLGEYIPLKAILGKLIHRLSPLKGELSPGNPQQRFQTPFGQAIVSICYESAFPETIREQVKRGGGLILSSANNAHYSDKMPAQHHALDVMRAIESDRWLVRATNTGYSAIISPQGKTIWLSRLNEYQLHQGQIYRRNTLTIYGKYGDQLTYFLSIITIVLTIFRSLLS